MPRKGTTRTNYVGGFGTNYVGGLDAGSVVVILDDRYNSECSPCNLNYARSHAELAGRPDRPVREGLNLREPLVTDDWTNWE